MKNLIRKNLITLILVSISTFSGCSLDEDKESITLKINGKITNELTGTPVRYSTVILFVEHKTVYDYFDWWDEGFFPADDEGLFDFKVAIGSWGTRASKLIAYKTGFENKEIHLERTNDVQIINIQLMPAISDYEIQVQGTVYDSNHVTIGGATVTLSESQYQPDHSYHYYPLIQTEADNNGFFQIEYFIDFGCPLPAISASKIGLGDGSHIGIDCVDTLITQDIYIPYKPWP